MTTSTAPDLKSKIHAIRRWQPFWLSVGLGWSTLALGLMIWGLHMRRHQSPRMSLGEMGEFFGGVATALSFGWLVIGYFLQSAELKINSLTLGHQAEQQESQAEQQRLMAKAGEEQVRALRSLGEAFSTQAAVSKQTLDFSKSQADEARRVRRQNIKPVFQITQTSGGPPEYQVNLVNSGYLAHNVIVSVNTDNATIRHFEHFSISNNEGFYIVLIKYDRLATGLTIKYTDIDGTEDEQHLSHHFG